MLRRRPEAGINPLLLGDLLSAVVSLSPADHNHQREPAASAVSEGRLEEEDAEITST